MSHTRVSGVLPRGQQQGTLREYVHAIVRGRPSVFRFNSYLRDKSLSLFSSSFFFSGARAGDIGCRLEVWSEHLHLCGHVPLSPHRFVPPVLSLLGHFCYFFLFGRVLQGWVGSI